ncbi:UNVERIFIED_CONTAM: hypothetical protein K2H54_053964 [Gekko kuhli]
MRGPSAKPPFHCNQLWSGGENRGPAWLSVAPPVPLRGSPLAFAEETRERPPDIQDGNAAPPARGPAPWPFSRGMSVSSSMPVASCGGARHPQRGCAGPRGSPSSDVAGRRGALPWAALSHPTHLSRDCGSVWQRPRQAAHPQPRPAVSPEGTLAPSSSPPLSTPSHFALGEGLHYDRFGSEILKREGRSQELITPAAKLREVP